MKLIFPFSIILIFLITKWWFVLPEDGPDKFFWGFPLAFMGEGFHTSMSFQFFLLEFIIDFFIYVIFFATLLFIIRKRFPNLLFRSALVKISWAISFVLLLGFGLLVFNSNPLFKWTRNYDWKLIDTGYIFIWQSTPRPEINSYHL